MTTVSDTLATHIYNMIRIGIDIGSTTAKLVATDAGGTLLYSAYERHNAQAQETITRLLETLIEEKGDGEATVKVTGSVGMGLAEQLDCPFVQEVVAATQAVQQEAPHIHSLIDIGGEDAKVVFFKDGEATDLRMNGNCAGGTGAFIDQMSVLLGTTPEGLNELALHATHTYPIASRCGVFSKTDLQNLIAKNVSREDLAASVFHAVAVQTVVTLARGCDLEAPVLMCGGPLTFLPALRKAFADYMGMQENDIILPRHGVLLPALGAAIHPAEKEYKRPLSEWAALLRENRRNTPCNTQGLPPIFTDAADYGQWKERIAQHTLETAPLQAGTQELYVGIDSGSTTTKIVATDRENRLLYTYYAANNGNPVEAVEKGLRKLQEACHQKGCKPIIKGSCSTGYGEDLIRTAFQLEEGIVETMAHYTAARHFNPAVTFLLDIGGQDMKALFIRNGVIERVEINEACSSGCGSFIETFARTLGYTAPEFAAAACRSNHPCDLGTRCTVFMNSKVKQVLREGATVDDIAAGLAYSVIKNCLYKVLKLKDTAALGDQIVVQGGTMRNDAVVRALERLTGTQATRCDVPELMGAYGCALHARANHDTAATPDEMLQKARYTSSLLRCHGCDNQCAVARYRFANGRSYYSGNRCERVFSNGNSETPGANAYREKNRLLFDRRPNNVTNPRLTLGLPRCLNMYENYPFWHTLFSECGIQVCLSEASNFMHYEQNARMVMSDNICFPAKLVHSHIQDLITKKVDRIFMPFVIFEKPDNGQNSYNCPIVTGYAEVIKGVQGQEIPIDSPAISFKDRDLLYRQCRDYLKKLGTDEATLSKAFAKAEEAQATYTRTLAACNRNILAEARRKNRFIVLLAGRPYHADPLIQHRLADLIAGMGIDVITDDLTREDTEELRDAHFLAQWTYPNRILKAARWCAEQDQRIQFVEMTSFGCGPDAFLTDTVRDLLTRSGKTFTLLKLDDINNAGSMKLRVRSLIESLKLTQKQPTDGETRRATFETIPAYTEDFRDRKILVPYFTPFLSPLIPAIMRTAGYDVENLPLSDKESCEWGLKYANNEVCYPATLIVGDVIKAFRNGRYDPKKSVIAMTQTGGQCRASNYLPLIRKALSDAGYGDTPVVSLTFGGNVDHDQPGLRINWLRLLPVALRAILYSDSIAKFYYAAAAREKKTGQAARLKELYLEKAQTLIAQKRSGKLNELLGQAARDFNDICRDISCPRIGIVGEIFLKFNPFAHKHLTDWLTARGIEAVPSALTDFFMQSFVNGKVRARTNIEKRPLPDFLYQAGYKLIRQQIEKTNRTGATFRYFIPFNDIFEEAQNAESVITLNAQFGEGWLLPAEIIAYARQGITHVVSLQPFGCIANHIVSKGIEKRIKALYPDLQLLSLDFDSGVSEVNLINRMLLFTDHFIQPHHV